MAVKWDMHYDRRVSPGFVAEFAPGREAHLLVDYARHAPYPVDFQLRHSAKTGAQHASLYVGLTAVLNVKQGRKGLRLSAHEKWASAKYGWNPSWSVGLTGSEWENVENYLESVIPDASASHASREGAVQTAVSVFASRERLMLDREAMLHFKDAPTRTRIMAEVAGPIADALQNVSGVPGKIKDSFGGKCDVLAIDDDGRLLAIEVKPKGVATTRWAAAQATVYALLFERWLAATDLPEDGGALQVLRGMAQQREQLGLAQGLTSRLAKIPQVVPVVAVQRGTSAAHLDGFRHVQQHLVSAGHGHPNLELHSVNMAGRLTKLSL